MVKNTLEDCLVFFQHTTYGEALSAVLVIHCKEEEPSSPEMELLELPEQFDPDYDIVDSDDGIVDSIVDSDDGIVDSIMDGDDDNCGHGWWFSCGSHRGYRGRGRYWEAEQEEHQLVAQDTKEEGWRKWWLAPAVCLLAVGVVWILRDQQE
jgi:hypothetical protein